MTFVVIGLLLVLLRWAEIGPVATLSWWWVLSPFAVAVVWWTWSDATGLTKRREMDKMDERRSARRARQIASLGRGRAAQKKKRR
jgi:small Trp-rich protein